MKTLFLDSSAIFSWCDADSAIGESIGQIAVSGKYLLHTTNLVFAEAISLITKRLHRHTALQVGDQLRTSTVVKITYIDESITDQAWQMMRKYHDKNFDLVDATSFVVCQQYRIRDVLTLDRHFAQMGFRQLPET